MIAEDGGGCSIRIRNGAGTCSQRASFCGSRIADGRLAGCGRIVEQETVSELDTLDIVKGVRSLVPDIVRDDDCSIAERDVVIGHVADVDSSVDVADTVRRKDLANDFELAGIDGSGEHRCGQRCHAVVRCNLDIVICSTAHTDAHVQPLVAVDDVIATTAGDLVTASTTEDDVASAERIDTSAE